MRVVRKVGCGDDAKIRDVVRRRNRSAAGSPNPGIRAVAANLARRKSRQRISRGKELLAAREAEVGNVADGDRTRGQMSAPVSRFDRSDYASRLQPCHLSA